MLFSFGGGVFGASEWLQPEQSAPETILENNTTTNREKNSKGPFDFIARLLNLFRSEKRKNKIDSATSEAKDFEVVLDGLTEEIASRIAQKLKVTATAPSITLETAQPITTTPAGQGNTSSSSGFTIALDRGFEAPMAPDVESTTTTREVGVGNSTTTVEGIEVGTGTTTETAEMSLNTDMPRTGEIEVQTEEDRLGLEDVQLEVAELRDQISSLKQQKEELQQKLEASSQEVSKLKQEKEGLEAGNNRWFSLFRRQKSKIKELERKIQELEKTIARSQAELAEMTQKIEQLEAENQELKAENERKDGKIADLEKGKQLLQEQLIALNKGKNTEMKKLRDRNFVLEGAIEVALEEQGKILEEEISQVKEEKQQLKEQLEALRRDFEESSQRDSTKAAQIQRLERQITDLEQTIERSRNGLIEIRQQIELLQAENETKSAEIEALKEQKQILEAQNQQKAEEISLLDLEKIQYRRIINELRHMLRAVLDSGSTQSINPNSFDITNPPAGFRQQNSRAAQEMRVLERAIHLGQRDFVKERQQFEEFKQQCFDRGLSKLVSSTRLDHILDQNKKLVIESIARFLGFLEILESGSLQDKKKALLFSEEFLNDPLKSQFRYFLDLRYVYSSEIAKDFKMQDIVEMFFKNTGYKIFNNDINQYNYSSKKLFLLFGIILPESQALKNIAPFAFEQLFSSLKLTDLDIYNAGRAETAFRPRSVGVYKQLSAQELEVIIRGNNDLMQLPGFQENLEEILRTIQSAFSLVGELRQIRELIDIPLANVFIHNLTEIQVLYNKLGTLDKSLKESLT